MVIFYFVFKLFSNCVYVTFMYVVEITITNYTQAQSNYLRKLQFENK